MRFNTKKIPVCVAAGKGTKREPHPRASMSQKGSTPAQKPGKSKKNPEQETLQATGQIQNPTKPFRPWLALSVSSEPDVSVVLNTKPADSTG